MNGSLARVPCTIVTGFLGAGKTTLIRHVLGNADGRRLAVIVNEFGDVGIDGDILKGCGNAACPEDNIVELANGCLCCTVADDFPDVRQGIEIADQVGPLVRAGQGHGARPLADGEALDRRHGAAGPLPRQLHPGPERRYAVRRRVDLCVRRA